MQFLFFWRPTYCCTAEMRIYCSIGYVRDANRCHLRAPSTPGYWSTACPCLWRCCVSVPRPVLRDGQPHRFLGRILAVALYVASWIVLYTRKPAVSENVSTPLK